MLFVVFAFVTVQPRDSVISSFRYTLRLPSLMLTFKFRYITWRGFGCGGRQGSWGKFLTESKGYVIFFPLNLCYLLLEVVFFKTLSENTSLFWFLLQTNNVFFCSLCSVFQRALQWFVSLISFTLGEATRSCCLWGDLQLFASEVKAGFDFWNYLVSASPGSCMRFMFYLSIRLQQNK